MSTGKEEKQKKRGSYRKVECPYCHKFVGNLPNHIRAVNQTEAERDQRPDAKPPELTKETLLGTAPKKPPETPEKTRYYCTHCRAELRYKENPCWYCGETLIWEGL